MTEVYASVCGGVSSDIPLGLPASHDRPDLHVELGSPARPAEDFRVTRSDPERFRLCLPGEAACDIDLGEATVVVHPAGTADPVELGHLVADHVLPRVAGERMYCLHAAAVAVAGRAYVLAGASGAGKSTLALRFARAGAESLGDDCAAILDGHVHPTFRAGRVWPDSLTSFGLPDVAPDASGKVCLDERHGVRLAGSPVPLAGIVLVGSRARRLPLQEALALVVGQRFHLEGRGAHTLVEEALDLLDRWGPIHEIDRRAWRPPGLQHHAGA